VAEVDSERFFRACSTCKQGLPYGGRHFVCSVSTCNRRGTAYTFCSVECHAAHVPAFNHRDAWAEERRSPSPQEWAAQREAETPRRVPKVAGAPRGPRALASSSPTPEEPVTMNEDVPRDILIVASKLKAYIRARSGMKTSDAVMAHLSDLVRDLCDEAIRTASSDGRKTVMDRDFRSGF